MKPVATTRPLGRAQRARLQNPDGFVCSRGWHVTGYFTPDEGTSGGPTQMITVPSVGAVEFAQAFLEVVRLEGWGRTRFGWFLGWDRRWVKNDVPLNARGGELRVGSLAVDPKIIPLGAKVRLPDLPSPWNDVMFIADDTGGAIKGRHVDVYCGSGEAAEQEARRLTTRQGHVCLDVNDGHKAAHALSATGGPRETMANQPMPREIIDWLQQRGWGDHHLRWHVERRWDVFAARAPGVIAWAEQQGWARYPVQEGMAGNGLEFLAMHRAMIRALEKIFPQHAALFAGWPRVPEQPDDPDNPVPVTDPDDPPRPLDVAHVDAAARLQDDPGSFATDDEFGAFVETTDRPTVDDPLAVSEEPGAGLHNYLHGRFSDETSPIDMGDPQVNLQNRLFWRLHGWIDRVWAGFREARGLQETDPGYVAALRAGTRHMGVEEILFPAPHPPVARRVRRSAGRAVLREEKPNDHVHHPVTALVVPPRIKKEILALLYWCPPGRLFAPLALAARRAWAAAVEQPPIDFSNLSGCADDTAASYLIKDDGPADPLRLGALRQRISTALPRLPPLYREAMGRPFLTLLDGITAPEFHEVLADDPDREGTAGALLDVAQAILQRGERFRTEATRAFQEVISDLYDGFLSAEDRVGVRAPDRSMIPPLVKWGRPDSGPYTWPVDALEEWELATGVVHLPASHTSRGLFGWATLGHETGGHDILGADTGLREELADAVRAALTKAKLGAFADYWAERIDETASDVMGVLNMGPAAALGLIGYFRGLSPDGKLRHDGPADDPHPADILRGYLGAASVGQLLFSQRAKWAAALKKETARDGSTIVLLHRKVDTPAAIRSAEVAARAIATTRVAALENHSLAMIQNWRDSDEMIVAQIRAVFTDALAPIPERAYAAHAVAAAITWAASKTGDPGVAMQRMIPLLARMNRANPSWGPLFVAHPGNLRRHRFQQDIQPDRPAARRLRKGA